jgi:HAD superfamily hydrolase (TIGR01509 family)
MIRRPILLFDVMETLVSEPFYSAMPRFFGMSFDEFRQAKHPTSWVEFELGEISEEEYGRRLFRDGRDVDLAGLRANLREAYVWLDGMQQLLEDLHTAGHPMHALSNYPVWYQLIEEQLKLSRFLQWTFVSAETGLRKPDPRVFSLVVQTLQVEPGDCLFLDDRELNVEAAREFGMDVILKEDASQVRRELERRRLV